jgi:hypothetical protein
LQFNAAPPSVSMSGYWNGCDRYYVIPTPATLVHMKMKTSGVSTPPCTVIYVPRRGIVDAETKKQQATSFIQHIPKERGDKLHSIYDIVV